MSTYKVKFEKNDKMASCKKKQKKEAKEIIEDSLPTFIEKNSGSDHPHTLPHSRPSVHQMQSMR
jgi:hypothetical protein